MHAAILIAVGLVVCSDALSASPCSVEPCRATIRDLVNQPSVFQGKRVVVEGVLDLRFEGHSIRHGKLRLSLALFTPDKTTGEYEEKQVAQDWNRIEMWKRAGLHGQWVEVRGVFDKKETGHFGMLEHGGVRNVEVVAQK